MFSTLVRLAFSGIRTRLLASGLTVLLAATAAATVVLALEVGEAGRKPWQQTFAAAHGAHVLANLPTEKAARALQSHRGVVEAGAPVPEMTVNLQTGDGPEPVRISGLSGRPQVNAPVRIAGTATPGDGIVLEHSLAAALNLGVGDRLTFAGDVGLRVVGTAVLPSVARYPRSNPGVAWVGRSTFDALRPHGDRERWTVALRLADPVAAPRVAGSIQAHEPPGSSSTQSWQDQRSLALMDAQPLQLILTMYTVVLLAVVFAVVAILVGARALEQYRQIGLLKAVGLTPRQVNLVFVIESAVLGLVAAVLGFTAGALLAPLLARPSSETMIGSPTRAANPVHLVAAAALVLLVLVLSTWLSTRRRTRFSVLHAIESGRAAPPRTSLAVRLVDVFPVGVPLAVGARALLAGRARALLLAGAISLTGAAFVFALSMQASLDAQPAGQVSDVPAELPVLVYTLDAVLLLIAITSLLAIALLGLRERLRDFGVLKAVGLTPRQVASTLVSPYAMLAVVASVLSIPVGIALYIATYRAAGGDGDPTLAPWPWLVLVPVAMVLLVVVATSVPARMAARASVADVLRTE
ncbi:MAG TPA: ABC transporter permease [Nocardioidaceae bacterium]|nr:ABC transporter permease [Nocardioidaceae bacterium]